MKAPKSYDFQNALDEIFARAKPDNLSYVDITLADLHRKVGGYPRINRMPNCCRVMKKNMRPGDEILRQPPSGQGASLKIRYLLPK
jgi:5-methylcytosine-specific restriction protein A